MPIFKSKGCKELGGEEERVSRRREKSGNIVDHHAQLLMEESMVTINFANLVFVFAGNTTVIMPYSLNNSHLVVLLLCTHYNEREAGVGTSMALVMLRRQLSDYDIMGELWHENFHVHCSTVLKIVINSAIAYKIQVDKVRIKHKKQTLPRIHGRGSVF